MQIRKIKIILEPGVHAPEYATPLSHGADVRANIVEPMEIGVGDRVMVPTGIRFDLPRDVEVQVRPRSGFAWKHGLTVLNAPGTIDPDYQGECKVVLINLGQEPYLLQPHERIAQFVFVQGVTQAQFEIAEDFAGDTERGAGGFGSTGK